LFLQGAIRILLLFSPNQVKVTQVASSDLFSLTSKAVLIAADKPLPPAQRLVVLVPNMEVDEAEFAYRIWSLASARRLDVLFLSRVEEAREEALARQRLARLAAITRDQRTQIETQIEFNCNWFQAVENIRRRGDVVVCHGEQRFSRWGWGRQVLAQALVARLNLSTYVLSGFYPKLLN
jgi:hypothetical protein